MSNVSNVGAAYNQSNVSQTKDSDKTQGVKKQYLGQTIGEPKLSDKAAKYYESLKKKYSNLDFILVSSDMKETAKSQASSYANANKMVVLIDEEKIEKMAEDEKYRKQFEGVIAKAAAGLSEFGSKLSQTGANVKGYGVQVNDDGTSTYFAVLEKSSAAQKQRIEKKAAEKREARKAEEKKAAKKERQERLEKGREKTSKADDTVTITASSMEELIQKVQDQAQLFKSDSAQTEAEKYVGQKFDYSI